MKVVRQIMFNQCLGIDEQLVSLRLSVRDIALRHHLTLQHWVEDGWGPGCGFNVLLENGLVIHLEQYEWSPDQETTIVCDGADLERLSADVVLDAAFDALGLPRASITWRNPVLFGEPEKPSGQT